MTVLSRLCSSYTLRNRIAGTRRRLYKVALAWCGSEMLADDLVQDALATALQKSHQLRDPERLNAWLFTILNNTWRQYLRRQRNECEYDDEQNFDERDPEGNSSVLQIVSRVRAAVTALPAEQRQVVALVDLEGFAYCEVAQVLDIPMGTVMSRLHRARKTLQNRLEELQPDQGMVSTRLHRVK